MTEMVEYATINSKTKRALQRATSRGGKVHPNKGWIFSLASPPRKTVTNFRSKRQQKVQGFNFDMNIWRCSTHLEQLLGTLHMHGPM